ncbi:MAG: aminopeptidase P family N-terminal domain-containing protein, partial [Rickettsiaceae bacterium]|nr:aminopeptidase P family N-terminal domain-containing protein [Rickettsiaceae bacterium]
METKSQINALRAEFVKFGINGYIIPSTDEYGSEYTSESARRLEYITGFTGSNGVAVITLSQSLFFTDSRYFEQARIELDKEFQIYDLKILREKLVGFDFEIGYDDMLFTEKQLNTFKSAKLKAIDGNLVDSIWQNKPEKPGSKIFHYPIEYSGEEFASKIARVRENMVSDYVLVTAADSICWLLNIRASDVEFCPLMLGYLVFSKDKIWLFINNPGRICLVEPHLPGLIVKDESEVKNFLFKLSGTVAVDLSFAPAGLARLCKNKLDI